MFKTIRAALACAALCGFAAAPVYAATSGGAAMSKPKTAQQERMTTCNKEATGKTGDTRKEFMKSCLKGESHSDSKLSSSQQRMKTCNAQASSKSLKGDARKTFMSTCLKAK
ncbi:PsiF repeat family protein [Candidimonas humi]|uniref:PsiF family protein n=1 Tax=Candidimonas humi TaxID=683355 RepID=A0ABV8P0N9_9BURK|nr:PsiF family protein [Candidimonas humi]MBV6306396.1 PsiF repeat family protein [Candidimonas humi]